MTPTHTRPARAFPSILALVFAIAVSGIQAAAAQQTAIERGEYLARAGDCVSCHTGSGGAPYAGGLRIDTPFGYMLTPNITPDPDTGIGRWSSNDFYKALHHGVNKRNQDMYPTMPFDFYTRVTRADIDAIYAYLRTVKPVRNAVEINHLDFPFNQRWSMAAWRELYSTRARTSRTRRSPPPGIAARTWSKAWATAAIATRRATSWAASKRARISPARSSMAGSRST